MDYALVEVTGVEEVVGLVPEFFPRPHLTPTLSPSMSMPFAQASAARSAESRSLKFTNAHLKRCQLPGLRESFRAYLDLATCTTDLSLSGFMDGSDLITVVRNDCSVASAGSDDKNRDIWSPINFELR